MTPDDLTQRVETMEGDLYRTHPDNPGAIIRLDRVERFLTAMLWVGGVLGGIGVAWKALDVIGQVIASKVTPP